MRKVIYTMLTLLAFVACQNEDIAIQNSTKVIDSKIQLVELIDGNQIVPVIKGARTVEQNADYALRFDSKATYNATLEQLEKMSNEERLAFAKNYGLQSLQELAQVADEELETIGTEAVNEVDFRTKYAIYKAKYDGLLVSNMYDSEDLSLYVPDGDDVVTFLIGKGHKIVVENEVKAVALSDEMGESDRLAFTREESLSPISRVAEPAPLGENHFKTYYEGNDRKVTFDIYIENYVVRRVALTLGAQKSMWYGWKRDDRDFYVDLRLDNFIYMASGNGHDYPIGRPDKYIFKNTGGKTGANIGNIGTLSPFTKGKAYVWTDRLTETELVTTKIIDKGRLIDSQERKCLPGRALIATVNLEVK